MNTDTGTIDRLPVKNQSWQRKREITCFNSFCPISIARQNNRAVEGSWSTVDALGINYNWRRERHCRDIITRRNTVFGTSFPSSESWQRYVERRRNAYQNLRYVPKPLTRSFFLTDHSVVLVPGRGLNRSLATFLTLWFHASLSFDMYE